MIVLSKDDVPYIVDALTVAEDAARDDGDGALSETLGRIRRYLEDQFNNVAVPLP